MSPDREIDALATDQERSDYCQRRAEEYRAQWYEGQRQEIAYVVERARVGDRRFRKMTVPQLETTGRSRWGRMGIARDLAEMEQLFTRWAHVYASRARGNAA